jgi:hypothetical protein
VRPPARSALKALPTPKIAPDKDNLSNRLASAVGDDQRDQREEQPPECPVCPKAPRPSNVHGRPRRPACRTRPPPDMRRLIDARQGPPGIPGSRGV